MIVDRNYCLELSFYRRVRGSVGCTACRTKAKRASVLLEDREPVSFEAISEIDPSAFSQPARNAHCFGSRFDMRSVQ